MDSVREAVFSEQLVLAGVACRRLDEADPDWETIQEIESLLKDAHHKASKAAQAVFNRTGNKRGTSYQDGWSSGAQFFDPGENIYTLGVGSNYVPKPGHYIVFFKLMGPLFNKSKETSSRFDRGLDALWSFRALLGKYGTAKVESSSTDTVTSLSVAVDEQHARMLADNLPALAEKVARALARVLGSTAK